MNWLIYIFGSGLALYVGAAIVLAAAGLFVRAGGGWRASAVTVLALAGLAVIVLSAAPLSYGYYGFALAVSLVWLAAERTQLAALVKRRGALRCAAAAVWVGAAALEAPHQLSPRLVPAGNPPLYVIGDSVSAGAGGESLLWTDLLPAAVEVHNLAQPGATARSALKQCESIPDAGGMVLLEIGGNDLLGSTAPREFERDLERLIERVAAPGRTVLMLELPLPPLMNEYGRIQRRLAARHGVRLIPKRVLMGVLATGGATLDSIHLAPDGHRRLAAAMWQVLAPAYDSPDGPTGRSRP